MKKDKPLKIIAVIAAILSGISVLLGCAAVIFPQLCGLVLSDLNFESWSIGPAVPYMLIEALFPLLLMTLAIFSAVSGTMTFKKGVMSAVLIVSYNIVKWLINYKMWASSLQLCVREGGSEMAASLNIVNSALTIIGYLNFFAVLLLISAASVEIYASKKNLNQR